MVAIGVVPADAAVLAQVLDGLPERAPLALVIAPCGAGEIGPELLGALPRASAAVEALPDVALEAGRVYFVAAHRPLVIRSGRFAAHASGRQRGEREPVAPLFASLADELGPDAVGVLLSGTGGDAVEGLRAIKARGGCAIVQDPATATYDEAPRAAVASGVADRVLAPVAIARELARIARRFDSEPIGESASAPELDAELDDQAPDETLRRLLSLLKSRFHVDLGHYKLTTLRRRIARKMTVSGFEHLAAYADHLRSDPAALRELYDDLFIHVTQFFRDPESFQALRDSVFPALLQDRSADEPIRIWVPGCSTGEEPYSIGMAMSEFIEQRNASTKLQIFATDVSENAIERARRATYGAELLQGVGARRIERFFDKVQGGYKINKQLRDLCIIARHDVTSNSPFAALDLISCRNVLIYFAPGLQKRIIPTFHYALKPGGFLWLGRAETPGASSKLFSLVDKEHKIYAKVVSAPGPLELASSHLVPRKIELAAGSRREIDNGEVDVQKSADQVVLFKYGPPGVVIDHDLEIVQFRGRIFPFLESPAGYPTHGILKMAHPDLLPALRSSIQAAKKQNAAARKERVVVHHDGTRRSLNLEVVPLNPLAAERDRQYLVLFEQPEARPNGSAPRTPQRRGRAAAHKRAARDSSSEQYIEQLQQELDAVREYQRALIEQSEWAQEELNATNEELQATNEELRSTNEELETAKQELQSANEELTTMNEELHSRNAELISVNEKLARGEDRFRLMVESVKDYAIYMLDPGGHVISWNEGARRLKGYEAAEILGEHYSRFFPPEDIAARAPVTELEVARIEGRFETEGFRVRKDGTRFWANVVVTRINDRSGRLTGFAKVTRDLTERRRAEQQLESSERRLRLMIGSVKDYAIFMLDPEWRIASWNEGARRLKGYEEAEIRGKHFSIFYPQEDVLGGKVQREVETVLAEGRVEDEGWRVRKDGSRFWANVVITRVDDPDGNVLGFTKVTRDLSERKRTEEALRTANESLELRVRERTEDLENALRAREEFLSIASHELKTPLTALKLQLQVAARAARTQGQGTVPVETALGAYDKALKQTIVLEELVEDLLDISRIQVGRLTLELKLVDLGALVEDIAARFAAQLAHAQSPLELDLERDVIGRWDERRISQVLVNLISNAIKYAPRSPIRIATSRDGALARIAFEDLGPGISADRLASIFQRFERAGASPSIGGLGLGLFIVRRIVEAHDGTITVDSEVGRGTRFTIELPLLPGTDAGANSSGEVDGDYR